MIWSGQFWKAAAERMIRAFAAGATGAFTAGATNLAEVPWQAALSAGVVAALVSLLISMGGSAVGPDAGPSLTGAERLPR